MLSAQLYGIDDGVTHEQTLTRSDFSPERIDCALRRREIPLREPRDQGAVELLGKWAV